MPFIRGRYHINPILGEALEAAREAEAALAAARAGHEKDQVGADDGSPETADAGNTRGPIHRVEIEAAEVVPAHSGHAQRGFVARIHRGRHEGPFEARMGANSFAQRPLSVSEDDADGERAERGGTPKSRPETHVFSDHRDLTDFLRGEFEKDCGK